MICPRCRLALVKSHIGRIEVDRCPHCSGVWLDYQEIDELEDTVLDVDAWKGTLVFATTPTTLVCPKCSVPMKRFDYRLFGLELEVCPLLHGYWLDAGEDKTILALMRKTKADALRKLDAEARWARFYRHIYAPRFVAFLRGLLGG